MGKNTQSRRHWYKKYQEAMDEASVLRDQVRKLEKGVRPLTKASFYPPTDKTDELHVNVFGERHKVIEFGSDLQGIKGYSVSHLEEGYKDGKREQKYVELSVKINKKQVIHIPKGDKWITSYWQIKVIDMKEEQSYSNPSEKNYSIRFRYIGDDLKHVTFAYNFMWSNWESEDSKREERIMWWIDKNKAEMSSQTEKALNNRIKFNETNVKKIRGILERKLEEIEDYKMLVPFIFTD